MTGTLLALGVSHKTAPLPVRERLALPEGRSVSVLRELVGHADVHEAVAISTCNRTEVYLVVSDPVEAESATLAVLARQAGIRPTELFGAIYSLRDADAVRHLFGVASGLDSMIVGEAEVQGQVKRAYELALVEGVPGPVSNRLFRDALAAGKRVRTETSISRAHVSVSSVAVELARAALGELSARSVLVIGAGENGELTARALHERGVDTVFVANRRYDRAIGAAAGGRRRSVVGRPPPLRPRDRPGAALGRPRGALRRAADPADRGRHRRERNRLAAPDRGARGDGARRRAAGRTPAADDRHRRAARHRAERARGAGRHALRHGRPAARGGAQHGLARGRGGARAEARGPGRRSLQRVARVARRGADHRGAARARRGRGRTGAARERAPLGVALGGRP